LVRKPAVADRFYPADAATLEDRLGALPRADACREATAVVVPHASLEYSGPVASLVYSQVCVPPTVLILGPNHCGFGKPVAVWPRGAWHSPLGDVAIDEGLAAGILAECPGVAEDAIPHINEHCVEMQIPFLKLRRPDVKIVPLVMSAKVLAQPDEILRLGRSLGRLLAGRPDVRPLVATTDMTHYEPDDEARRKDRLAIDQILDLDPLGLFEAVKRSEISMCGCAPVMAVVAAALELGARGARLVDYRTSADVNNQTEHVVGYAGIVIE